VREDSAELAADESGNGPEAALRRLRGLDRLSGRARRIACSLALWREREAERLDLARPFLLRDETLVALARQPLASAAELRRLPGYEARRHAAHADRWLAALAAARAEAERGGPDPLPRPDRSPVPLERLKRVGHALAETVARRAAALELAPELLLSRRQRDRILRAWDGVAALSGGLTGWRRELLADDVDAAAG
jgi:ribonuclease D